MALGNIKEDESKNKVKTLVFTANECMITSSAKPKGARNMVGALAGFLLPLAVEYVLGEVSKDLTKIRKQESTGSVDFPLWKRTASAGQDKLESGMPRCITVVTARFDKGEISKVLDTVNGTVFIDYGSEASDILTRLNENGITLTSGELPMMVFEAQVEQTNDKTGYYLKPVYFSSFELIPGNKAKKQGVVYNVALRGPGATPWGAIYSGATISLGDVTAGTILHSTGPKNVPERLNGLKTGALLLPGISEAAFRTFMHDGIGGDGQRISEFMPANLEVKLVQTKKPSDAAKLAAALIGKATPTVSTWVGGQFDADAKFKAAQAEAAAKIAYLSAVKECTEASAGTDAEKTEIKRLVLENAARAWLNLNPNANTGGECGL